MAEFGEPWRVERRDQFAVSVESKDDEPDTLHPVAYMSRFQGGDFVPEHLEQAAEDNRNAERIVACVNALAGLEPEAVACLIEAARRWREEPKPLGITIGNLERAVDALGRTR